MSEFIFNTQNKILNFKQLIKNELFKLQKQIIS